MEQLEGLSTTTWSSCFNQKFLQGISKLIKKIIPPQCSNDLKSLGSERGGGDLPHTLRRLLFKRK